MSDPEVKAVVPWSPSLSVLSSHSRHTLDQIHEQIHQLSVRDRTRWFQYGRLYSKARDTIVEDSGDLGTVQAFIQRLNIREQDFYLAIRIFERFEPYEQLLSNIGVRVQRHIAEHTEYEDQLQFIVSAAKKGEITYVEFEEAVLCSPEAQRDAERAAEEADEASDPGPVPEEDRLNHSDQTEEPADEPARPPKPPTLAQLEGTRKELVKQAFDDIGDLIRNIDRFTKNHKIRKLGWFEQVESGADCLLSGMKAWTKIEPV